MSDTIILAGATGNLGGRIAHALADRGASVRAIVRPGTAEDKLAALRATGAEIVAAAFDDPDALRDACEGGACVVSALSGLVPVIVDAQTRLLEAAVAAGVPRFIPSDFSIDYQLLPFGSNRNFDLRRVFRARVDAAPIRATSIFNGAFADMLVDKMPVVVPRLRRVLYFNGPDIAFDVTTMDDTAAFTAEAALDANAPRDLHIAGSRVSARDLAAAMAGITGKRFRVARMGGLGRLELIIRVARRLFPQPDELYSAWQGMQYLHNMFSGLASAVPLDNSRYPRLRWTSARDVLAAETWT